MARITATYADGLTATFDDSASPMVTGDPELLAALDAQTGIGPAVIEGVPLLLAGYDLSPEHFLAATTALRAPEVPERTWEGIEAQAPSHAGSETHEAALADE